MPSSEALNKRAFRRWRQSYLKPCPVCQQSRPWKIKKLLPQEKCKAHNYTDPRHFESIRRDWQVK